MITYPDKPWNDGQTIKYTTPEGEEVIGIYSESKNAWTFTRLESGGGGAGGLVTTADVRTLNTRPDNVSNPFDLTNDPSTIVNQQEVNWYLWEDIQHILWINDEAPTPDISDKHYSFWFNTTELALYVWNDAWFPVSGLGEGGVSTETFTYTISQIQRIIDEVYLKNIAQDNRLDVLEENIGELEEEIDALAPSNERGEWNFNPVGVASPGYYAFLDSNTQPTERFDAAVTIYVSTRDAQSTTHSFNNHEAGEYLQIFNKENDGYGLYVITDIDDNSSSPNPFFAFTVDFVRSLVSVPKAVNRGRFKFFTIAEGDPGAYVLKTGDEMEGNLKFKDNNQVQTRYLNSGEDSNLQIQRKGETKILVGSDNVQMQKPIKFVASSFATANEHAIHKGYVDEQIAELLAKIEELEMSGGQPENIRIGTFKVGYPRSGNSTPMWKQIGFNELITSTQSWYPSSQQNWKQADFYFYICLPNEYQMNPTGGYIISQPESGRYSRNTNVCNMTFDAVESHPLQDNSTTHTVWKVGQIPTDHEGTGGALQEFANQSSVVLTFYGGSLTKVAS